jgi:hypothetical protein
MFTKVERLVFWIDGNPAHAKVLADIDSVLGRISSRESGFLLLAAHQDRATDKAKSSSFLYFQNIDSRPDRAKR